MNGRRLAYLKQPDPCFGISVGETRIVNLERARVVLDNVFAGEMARQLYARLQSEDVVVADSAIGTYVDLVLVQSAHADAQRAIASPLPREPQIQGWTHRVSQPNRPSL